MGLGLAVARGFAEAMDGTLTAEDTPGGGLTMVLTLRAVTNGRPQAHVSVDGEGRSVDAELDSDLDSIRQKAGPQ